MTAAERVFGERGYRASRLEDIAAIAHIRRPSLLYHFGSKANLYKQVVGHALDELRSAVHRGIATDGDFPARISSTTNALLTFEANRRPLVGVIMREMLDSDGVAREVVAEKMTPLIDDLELFISSAGVGHLPEGVPVRSAIMHLMMGHLARASMAELGVTLFGGDEGDHIIALSRRMFLS